MTWACGLGILAAFVIGASLGFAFGLFWAAAHRD
jgi:hypothetical protein